MTKLGTSGDGGRLTEEAGDWRAPVTMDSPSPLQRLAMIEQGLAGLGLSLQGAASRQGVADVVKAVEDKIEALESRLKAFEGIVTETLAITTRLDGLDRAKGEVLVEIQRLPSRTDISQVLDNTARVAGSQTTLNTELGRFGGLLGRLVRWQFLSAFLFGAGVLLATAALLILVAVLSARPG